MTAKPPSTVWAQAGSELDTNGVSLDSKNPILFFHSYEDKIKNSWQERCSNADVKCLIQVQRLEQVEFELFTSHYFLG